MTSIAEIFQKEGEPYLGHAAQAVVDQGKFIWWISEGYADFFLQNQSAEQGLVGDSWALFRVDAGEFFFDLPAENLPIGYIRMMHVSHDALCYRLPRENFYPILQNPETRATAELLLARLIKKQLHPKRQHRLPPKQTEPLHFGEQTVAEGGHLFSDLPLSWVKVRQGQLEALSIPTEILKAGSIFPLTNGGWLTAKEAAELSILKTAELSLAEAAQAGDQFQGWIVQAWLTDWEHVSKLRQDRADLKQTMEGKEVDEGMTAFMSVLEEGEPEPLVVDGEHTDLLRACQKIGSHLGINFKPLSVNMDVETTHSTLRRLVAAAGARCREVTLSEGWWLGEEPLLCFTREDHQPVALLPKSSGGYEIYDPANHELQPFTPALAENFERKAFTFHQGLPESVGLKNILSFGFQGTGLDFAHAFWMSIIAGLLALLMPYTYDILLNQIIPDESVRSLAWLSGVLVVAALVSAGIFLMRGMAIVRLEGRTDYRLQAALWDRLLKLPLGFFRHYSTGDLAMRALGFFKIRALLSNTVVASFFAGIFSLLYVGMLLFYNLPLSLLAILLLLFLFSMTLLSAKRMISYTTHQTNIAGHLAGFVLQLLTGIAKLKMAGAERRAFARWSMEYAEQEKNAFKSRMLLNLVAAMNAAFPALMSLAVFAGAILFWQNAPNFSVGAFLTFNTALASLVLAVTTMGSSLLGAVNVLPFYRRLAPILEARPEVDEQKRSPGVLTGRLSVKHLAFRYGPEAPLILQDISFDVAPGELIALVGYSGCGKSTLLRLLLGFEQASMGNIYYDDQNIASLNIAEVRTQIGVVLQSGRLVPGSIFQNIVGALPYGMEEAWQAARLCGLAEEIEAMPMGMHTFISEGATTLSGGQRQLILIARALISRPRLLFFDEATSALDNQTQAVVTKSLNELHATRIIIAHRLSTVKAADRILVLRDGCIVESGSYEELLAKNGYFAELAKQQLA